MVDEISRRVCDLAEHDVVDKEVVTSELLAALEATTDGTKGRFLVRGIYDICVWNSNINGSGTSVTAKGGEDGYDDSTYMPLYRAMKSGGAHVCSTFLYYATLKEKDIERFQRLFYRTILERNEWSDGVDVFVISSGISASCARQGRVFCRAGDIDEVFAMV